jgi:nicotinate-nucleotide adenylyltransferase
MTPLRKPSGFGVFGGTFNPIHCGHLRAAEEAAEALELERILFVPCAQPPHKQEGRLDVLAPAHERLEWARLAVEGNSRFAVDPLETERGGASYSVETLRALRERSGPEPPVFLIGCDAFREIESWREPKTLLTLAHFAVITRPPIQEGDLSEWLPAALAGEFELDPDRRSGRHRSAGTWIRWLEIGALDISSSEIRRRLREGRSVRYLVPDRVREAILVSRAYGPGVA